MIAALITISVITAILAGFSKAICDLSEEGKLKFYRKSYWIKSISWDNKYKDNDPKKGAKFLGSTSVFVMFTDAWHLFQFFYKSSLIISFTIVGYLISISDYFAIGIFTNQILIAATFHIFHTYKILKK